MEFDPIRLEALLDLLVTSGVEEFEGFGFHVRFTERMFGADKVLEPEVRETKEKEKEREERSERNIWENEALWPGGTKPGFPK